MDEGKLKRERYISEESDAFAENDPDYQAENQNTIPQRRSYVWNHYSPVPGHSSVYSCNICHETFGNKTANLGRHLHMVHNIQNIHRLDAVKKGRPNRSFVWNFCTKLDDKRALCHICKKILYFGGGNTSNITKHLRRMHSEKIEETAKHLPGGVHRLIESPAIKKERKGLSYVWNYCDKLSKNTVLCKLCNRRMRFHGTANVISHLQRRHDIMDETSSVKIESTENVQEAATSSTNESSTARSARKGSISGSLVWKYITRVSDDTVRCRVCLKILSYQGTSNLQRHLHRMHNIMWSSHDTNMPYKTDTEHPSDNTLLVFCDETSDPSILKCQMCDEHFEHHDNMEETVSSHMIATHGAAMRTQSDDLFEVDDDDDEITALYTQAIGVENNTAGVTQESANTENETEPVDSDEALYDELIEVEGDLNDIEMVGEQLIETGSFDNSLSAEQSAGNVYSDYSNESTDAQLVTTTIEAEDTQLIRALKEDLLRQQAMYFSEKAGFYRMQKFLVAQQVRKERLEIEKLKADEFRLN